MRAPNVMNYDAAPFDGPMALYATMADAVAAPLFEGLWLPVRYAKSGSIELAGSFTTIQADIYATNQAEPLNSQAVTIGGTITNGDVATLTFANPLAPNGQATVSYPITGSDTTTTIAAGLAHAITTNVSLTAGLGFSATSNANVLTITWPSIPPILDPQPMGTSGPPPQNITAISGSVSGSATETIAVALGTDGQKIASLTAAGIQALSISGQPIRWLKCRIPTLTGSTPSVSVLFAGVA